MNSPLQSDPSNRRWLVCGMLLLALVLNYMDRQTLSLTITAIESEIGSNNQQYGRLEKGFGYAFAAGSIIFGLIADRASIRWLYPFVLLGWSAAGLATGYADRIGNWLVPGLAGLIGHERLESLALTQDPELMKSYLGFLILRVTLGFFEAGQWPCALVTTQRLLARADRPLGNSILQAGASLGAILTPVVVTMFAPPVQATETIAAASEYQGWWRLPYVVIGSLGVLWVVPWLWMVWGIDLSRKAATSSADGAHASSDLIWTERWTFIRRYLSLIVVVATINLTWQYFRVWMPKMLEQYHGYRPDHVRWFITAYYLSTDLGCIAAGISVKIMASRGSSVHRARLITFAICAALTSLSTVASTLPQGWLLLLTFLVIGFGALGLFPNYYSFTQELSTRHQGLVSGSLGFIAWVISSEMQERVGKIIDQTHSYAAGIFWIGLAPLLGLMAMLVLWGRSQESVPARTASS